jgi:hypothetical protein
MAGKVKSDSVIEQLQRAMALEKSGTERPNDSEKGYVGCTGHACSPACGFEGYCDFEATRYYNNNEGQTQSQNSKGERHSYYKREMRLGYNSSDY